MQHTDPAVSVVIPVRNGRKFIESCLEALRRSSFQRFEVLVVDDGSRDETPELAEALGARVLRRDASRGPAAARNLGAAETAAPLLLFLDADVEVHEDTVGRAVRAFERDPGLAALFGSYDRAPSATNAVSQFKNLFHHFVHHETPPQASTFWSGCGAIRREVFEEFGGFDETFRRPSIEDIELGMRLREADRVIRIDADMEVKHHKRWNLRTMFLCDTFDRALPWMGLLLRRHRLPNTLNLRWSHRVLALLSAILAGLLGWGIWRDPVTVGGLLLGWLLILALDAGIKGTERPRPPVWTALLLVELGLAVATFLALPAPARWALGLAAAGFVGVTLPRTLFFARNNSWLFALAALPFQAVYGVAALLGAGCALVDYAWSLMIRRDLPEKRPLPTEESAQRGP